MRKYFTCFLFLLFSFSSIFCLAQHSKIDALKILANKANADSAKANELIAISSLYLRVSNFDSALRYSQLSLQVAEKIDFKKGVSSAYSNIGIVYNWQSDYSNALSYYLKALVID